MRPTTWAGLLFDSSSTFVSFILNLDRDSTIKPVVSESKYRLTIDFPHMLHCNALLPEIMQSFGQINPFSYELTTDPQKAW
jgi:hypothetical protein